MKTEATLAGPLSPLVLVIGGAVVTGAIVFGVVAGPGTIACIQRGDFPQCMTETVFGDGTPATAQTDEAASSDVAAVQDSTATPQPSEASGTDDTAADIAAAVMPAFGLVRVEPDGSAVIAGTATPSGEVQIFANDEVIGTEIAEPSGDWAHVTAAPLPTGGLELRVFDVEADAFAEESVMVVVQDDRSSEPLVVAIAPGEASDILQAPQGEEMQVAQATEAAQAGDPAAAAAAISAQDEAEADPADSEDPAAEPTAQEPISQEDEGAEPVLPEASEPAVDEVNETPALDASETDSIEIAQTEQAEAEQGQEPAQVSEPATSDVTEPESETAPSEASEMSEADAEAQTATPALEETPEAPEATDIAQTAEAGEDAAPQAEEAAPAEATPSSAEVESAAVEPVVVLPPPSIDAVEIDGDLNFFAGAGTDGYAVRLYVDNSVVATTTVADGRWLIEAIDVLDQPSQRVRIDMLDDDGTVVGRAEVNFVLDIPQDPAPGPEPVEDEERLVVAQDNVSQTEAPQDSVSEQPAVAQESTPQASPVEDQGATPPPATEPAATNAPETAQAIGPAPTPSAAEASEEAPSVPATADMDPTSETPSVPQTGTPGQPTPVAPTPSAPSAPAPETAPAPTGQVAPEQVTPEPVTPQPVAPEPETPESPVAEESALEPETPDQDVVTLVGVTEGDRTVAGRAIIRRGDNLWTIARRVYGEGIRYTQIFDANTGQIRDPDLIYPGQVFDLPGTDVVIGNEQSAQ